MSSPPGFAHFVSLRLPPRRGQRLRPGKAGSAAFLDWVASISCFVNSSSDSCSYAMEREAEAAPALSSESPSATSGFFTPKSFGTMTAAVPCSTSPCPVTW